MGVGEIIDGFPTGREIHLNWRSMKFFNHAPLRFALGIVWLGLFGCERNQPVREVGPVRKETSAQTSLEPSGEQIGRYQVVSSIATLADGSDVKLTVKIDTVTGTTWKYQIVNLATGVSNPKYLSAEGWEELPDKISDAVRKAETEAERFKSGEWKLGK